MHTLQRVIPCKPPKDVVKKAKPAVIRGGDEPWRAALDDEHRVYYFKEGTEVAQWKRPVNFGNIGLAPQHPCLQGVALDESLGGVSDEDKEQVLNFVVLERSFDPASSWRIASLGL